jgi:hypothetical protein
MKATGITINPSCSTFKDHFGLVCRPWQPYINGQRDMTTRKIKNIRLAVLPIRGSTQRHEDNTTMDLREIRLQDVN